MKKCFKLSYLPIAFFLNFNAFAQTCPVDINVKPMGDGLVVVSIHNISSRDVDILYDFLPWSVFGFGVNYSAKYRDAKTEIKPIYAVGHRPETVVLKANSSMQQEISLFKRFHYLRSDAGIVDVSWSYRFAEPGVGSDICTTFKGEFSIFETLIKQTSE